MRQRADARKLANHVLQVKTDKAHDVSRESPGGCDTDSGKRKCGDSTH
jgi:hypothetical protein